ncbi:DUF5333 family protein [Roseobacter sinensis]|uniref:DUF5333 family protein n=1 Tax=Roseobacter sinensis TaxID=2931391 RepID=A0ABT3BFV7_9RHOB|nr:DUF5333 family protein [Roseobacter sp. WL0113]MCV3272470.1 DUF5333 family protein [Roseobacter sp. WL0113]
MRQLRPSCPGWAVTGAATLALAACGPVGVAPQGTPGDIFGTTEGGGPSLNYIYDEIVPLSAAGYISDNCDTIAFSQVEEDRMLRDLKERVLEDGITPNQMDAIFKGLDENAEFQRRLSADQSAYIQRWLLDEDRPETFCAAGKAELAANSKVARFLIDTERQV